MPRRQTPQSSSERSAHEAAAYLEAHADEDVTLAALATEVGLSPAHLQRTFTRVYGHSPKQYQAALRAETLRARLKEGVGVADAGYRAGFGSSRGVYEAAQARLGMAPGTYRRGGAGMRIGYATAPSLLGRVLVGMTAGGVCAVLLADSDREASAALASEFPAATLADGDPAADVEAAAVASYLAGGPLPDTRIDLHGTPFQKRVWTALRRVPTGTTVTYAEVARVIGAPSAHRAVAGACGANHVALLVPCHRVVRTDGGLGGYKWGVERKRRLLEREASGR
jgi:AraC family transcriptional regulator of adaptative response/methylated-DNA-[protein]-cysteine methyltransferase